jgi:hypothetical protein
MSIKSFIASQANGIRIAISGWGNNKNVFKNPTSSTLATLFSVACAGDVGENKRFILIMLNSNE